jgi:hypothetical protein
MRFSIITAVVAYSSAASAAINWSLQKASNPTADQLDAYKKIESAMTLAAARYARFTKASKTVRVYYSPGVPTAEANYNGDLRFGSDRSYMTERTAMHEIAHTLGVGQYDILSLLFPRSGKTFHPPYALCACVPSKPLKNRAELILQ